MFEYDEASRRYRDQRTGRFVSQTTITGIRDQMIDQSMTRINGITDQMLSGGMSRTDWMTAMRSEIKTMQVNEYMLARGGRDMMTPADWGRIGAETRKQYAYLDRFAAEIDAGTLSDAQIRARSRMYTAGSNASYARGQQASWNVQLPAHPGDGSTRCLNYCRCSWELRETETEILATWMLGPSQERCPDCLDRSRRWAPLRFDRGTGAMKGTP